MPPEQIAVNDFRRLLAVVQGCGPGVVEEEDVKKCEFLYLAWVDAMNALDPLARPHELTFREAALIAAFVGVPTREHRRKEAGCGAFIPRRGW